jgi:hypothetical protein
MLPTLVTTALGRRGRHAVVSRSPPLPACPARWPSARRPPLGPRSPRRGSWVADHLRHDLRRGVWREVPEIYQVYACPPSARRLRAVLPRARRGSPPQQPRPGRRGPRTRARALVRGSTPRGQRASRSWGRGLRATAPYELAQRGGSRPSRPEPRRGAQGAPGGRGGGLRPPLAQRVGKFVGKSSPTGAAEGSRERLRFPVVERNPAWGGRGLDVVHVVAGPSEEPNPPVCRDGGTAVNRSRPHETDADCRATVARFSEAATPTPSRLGHADMQTTAAGGKESKPSPGRRQSK